MGNTIGYDDDCGMVAAVEDDFRNEFPDSCMDFRAKT
jgi:hypothetical protein